MTGSRVFITIYRIGQGTCSRACHWSLIY